MANLLFKKGLLARLPETKVAGTVYVTTDERSMYVDISDSERIRIQGSVLYYSTLQEFYNNTKPPYSTDVIYFIEKDKDGKQFNALMRWDGSKWVQLNATAESVQAAITSLQTAINETNGVVDVIKGYVGVPAAEDQEATGLHAAVNAAQAQANLGVANAAIADGKAVAAQGTADTALANAATAQGAAEAAQGTANEAKGKAEANARAIQNINTALEGKASVSDFNTLKGRVDTAETDIDNVEARVKAIEDAPYATEADVTEVADDLTELSGIVTNIQTEIGVPANAEENQFATGLYAKIAEAKAAASVADGKGQSALNAIGDETNGLVKDIKDNKKAAAEADRKAVAAQSTADGAAAKADENAGAINILSGVVGNTEGGLVKDVADNAKAIEDIVAEIGDADSGMKKDIADNADAIKALEDILGISGETEGETIDGRISDLEQWQEEQGPVISKNTQDIGTINGQISTINGQITGLDTRLGTAEGTITNHGTRLNTLENTTIPALTNRVKANEDDILEINGKLELVATKDELKTAKETLEEQIDGVQSTLETQLNTHILAANAMRYKGAVEDFDSLPTENVEIGDTYIASKAFKIGERQVYAGDLLVAEGTENASGKLETITWTVVDTGYIENHENSLSLENGNIIMLKSHLGEQLGAITVASTSENVKISSTNGQLSVGLEWAEF